MSKEQEPLLRRLTGIHINLVEGTVVLDMDSQPSIKLSVSREGTIYQALDEPSEHAATPQQATPAPESQEKRKPVTLTGRLKAKPREGRPDRTGRPTAYARFAAHEEGRDEAHDYIATFHRHTAKIALTLDKEAQLTVSGYPHRSGSDKRLDTFSVINLINFPGKQPARGK